MSLAKVIFGNQDIVSLPLEKSKGSLVVPKNAAIIYGEPAVFHNVKKNTKLYGKPPGFRKDQYVNGANEKLNENDRDQDIDKYLITRQVKATTDTNGQTSHNTGHVENVVVSHLFQKSEKVLVRQFEYPDPNNPQQMIKHPFLLQVATIEDNSKSKEKTLEFRLEKTDQTELKQLGYMYADDIVGYENDKRIRQDIFPHLPSIEDIRQRLTPNCFLLAAIMSMLNEDKLKGTTKGAEFIMNMMKQQDDGSVIVKLYHPITLEPVYVRVENSDYQFGDIKGALLDAVGHKASWVYILEKAYAGLGYTQHYDKKGQKTNVLSSVEIVSDTGKRSSIALSPASFLAAYGQGGESELAMTILTGQKATKIELVALDTIDDNEMAEIIKRASINDAKKSIEKYIDDYIDSNFDVPKGKKLADHMIADITDKVKAEFHGCLKNIKQSESDWTMFKMSNLSVIFQDQADLLNELIVHLQLLRKLNLEEFKNINNNLAYLRTNRDIGPDKLSEIIKQFSNVKSPAFSSAIINVFINYQQQQLIQDSFKTYSQSGSRGSGQYDRAQYQLYKQLKSAAEKGQLLTICSKDVYPGDNPKGIVKNHAYTITDVYEREVNGKQLFFLRLKNPWNFYGRTYDFKDNKTSINGSDAEVSLKDKWTIAGELDIELSDVNQYFQSCSIGELPKQLQLIDQVEQNLLQKPFKTLMEDEKIDFVRALSSRRYSQQRELASQGLDDLYRLSRFLQNNIVKLQNKLKTSPSISADIRYEIKQEKRLLRTARSQFNQMIVKNKDALLAMKSTNNANLNDKPKRNLISRAYSLFKVKLDMALTKGRFTNRYLEIYENHHQSRVSRASQSYADLAQFTKVEFNILKDDEKNKYLETIIKIPSDERELLLKSRPLDQLHDMYAHCQSMINAERSLDKSDYRQLLNDIDGLLANTAKLRM